VSRGFRLLAKVATGNRMRTMCALALGTASMLLLCLACEGPRAAPASERDPLVVALPPEGGCTAEYLYRPLMEWVQTRVRGAALIRVTVCPETAADADPLLLIYEFTNCVEPGTKSRCEVATVRFVAETREARLEVAKGPQRDWDGSLFPMEELALDSLSALSMAEDAGGSVFRSGEEQVRVVLEGTGTSSGELMWIVTFGGRSGQALRVRLQAGSSRSQAMEGAGEGR